MLDVFALTGSHVAVLPRTKLSSAQRCRDEEMVAATNQANSEAITRFQVGFGQEWKGQRSPCVVPNSPIHSRTLADECSPSRVRMMKVAWQVPRARMSRRP